MRWPVVWWAAALACGGCSNERDAQGPADTVAASGAAGMSTAWRLPLAQSGGSSGEEQAQGGEAPLAGAGGSVAATESDCRDGEDDDVDGLADCDDPDCAAFCSSSCSAVPLLPDRGATAQLGEVDDLDLSCSAGGPELVFRYVSDEAGPVAIRLTSEDDLRMALRTGCDDGEELACGQGVVSATMEAGQTLYLVVEGVRGDGDGRFLLIPAGCGDGVVDPTEECDDGGTDSGDGCSAACRVELSESPNNDTIAEADPVDGEFYVGSMGSAEDVDFLRVAVESSLTELVVTSLDVNGGCFEGTAIRLELVSADGEVVAEADPPSVAGCRQIVISGLAAGEYFVRVSTSGELFAYELNVTSRTCGNSAVEWGELCDDGNVEDGDGCSSSCFLE